MKTACLFTCFLLMAVSSPVFAQRKSQDFPKYRIAQTFTLGGDGGWDYVTFDPDGNRLFIARSTRVMVVDANTGKLITEIPDTPGVHGVALVPDVGRGFISAGRAGQVIVFDLKSLKKVGTIKAGENPDAIIYDPGSKHVVVMNGASKDVMFIDPEKMTVLGTVPVGGKPEFAASDERGTVYVNIEDKAEVVALDSHNMSQIARWKLESGHTGCEEPTGIAIDNANQRLFSVCAGDNMMVISDAKAHKVIKTVPIGEGSDGVVYDAAEKAIISSNGEGTITVVQQHSADEYSVAHALPTSRGARTIALDPKTHHLFLITAKFEQEHGESDQQHRRPPMVPGSFEVIVCEPIK